MIILIPCSNLCTYAPVPGPTSEVIDTIRKYHWSYGVCSAGCFRLAVMSAFGAYDVFLEKSKDDLNAVMKACAYSNSKMHEMASRAYLAVPKADTTGEISNKEVIEALKVQELNEAATARIFYGLMTEPSALKSQTSEAPL